MLRTALVTGRILAVPVIAIGLLAACSRADAPDDETNPVQATPIPRVVLVTEALVGADIPVIDPATMVDAEIEKGVGAGARCEFRYTSAGEPVLAIKASADETPPEGVVKLNGHLVQLQSEVAEGGVLLWQGEVRLTLTPDGGLESVARTEATLVFQVGDRLRVGYRGYYRCRE